MFQINLELPSYFLFICVLLGVIEIIDINKIIPNKSISITNGGIKPLGEYKQTWVFHQLEMISKKYKFDLTDKIKDIPKNALEGILYGLKETFKIQNKIIDLRSFNLLKYNIRSF